MTISSRTPEGSRNHCPVCGHDFRIEPSLPSRNAPCPACGVFLWFGDNGSAEGMAAGLAAGKAAGLLSGCREVLSRMLQRRFGRVPPTLLAKLQSCTDMLRLNELADNLLEVASLPEFERLIDSHPGEAQTGYD